MEEKSKAPLNRPACWEKAELIAKPTAQQNA